jgi:hypothetical protein
MDEDKPDSANIATGSDAEVEPELTPGASSTSDRDPASAPDGGVNHSRATVTFRGNSYDLMAVVGVTIGAAVLLTCATCNFGYYCLPFVPILLGAVGLATADDSVDPPRTRRLSWISLGSGAAILLLIFFFIIVYIGFIAFVIALDQNGGF